MKLQIKVSKLDVAKRQLETAIRIYFSEGDPVSLHTLTAASYNVIRDLNKKKGGEQMMAKDGFMAMVKPGRGKEVWERVVAAENFFKHADKDHDGVLDFNPEQSEFLILEACDVYRRLTGEFPSLFRLYQTWYIAMHPNLFTLPDEQKRVIAIGADEMKRLGRMGYFTTFLPTLTRFNA